MVHFSSYEQYKIVDKKPPATVPETHIKTDAGKR